MNHFHAINQPPPSSSMISLLTTDDTQIDHQSYSYDRKRVNDEYIQSLLRFVQNVEETKRDHRKKMAAKANEPWDALLRTTPPTQTKPPYNRPIIHVPPPPPTTPTTTAPQYQYQQPAPPPLVSPPPLPPKIDQNRMPLTTHRIPRRNVLVSKFLKYYHKLQRRVPSFVFVTDKTSSSPSPSTTVRPKNSGYPSWSDFRPMHSDYDDDDEDEYDCPGPVPTFPLNQHHHCRRDWTKYVPFTCPQAGAPTTTAPSTPSDATWVISNQTSVFC